MTPTLTRLVRETAFHLIRRLRDHISKISAPMTVVLEVHIAYNEGDEVWYTAKSDIPGLCLKAKDSKQLIRSIEQYAHKMIELGGEDVMLAMRYAPTGSAIALRPVFDSPLRLRAFARKSRSVAP